MVYRIWYAMFIISLLNKLTSYMLCQGNFQYRNIIRTTDAKKRKKNLNRFLLNITLNVFLPTLFETIIHCIKIENQCSEMHL